ncbi:MAG: DNA repair protein RadC [Lachnospiraceae bacterium]|nr:DNA repair protein RadC [Lachnospiraceae bacterium]
MNRMNTMKDIPNAERPYEKFLKQGAEALSDAELLAVLLRTGTKGENVLALAKRLLYEDGGAGLLGIHQFSFQSLMKLKGIGKVKAVQILCLSELAKRLSKASVEPRLRFSSSQSVAEYYMEDLRHRNQEVMKLLLLNSKAELIDETNISKGTVNASLVTPRELFVEALKKEAVSMILLHNHPSGDPTPSRDDILTTKRISECGLLIGIELLDHIIIGNNCYVSFQEENLLWKG